MTSPSPTRYTLDPADGCKASLFGLALGFLRLARTIKAGKRYRLVDLAQDAGCHPDTVRRILYDHGTFETSTLNALAGAFGYEHWEIVCRLGQVLRFGPRASSADLELFANSWSETL